MDPQTVAKYRQLAGQDLSFFESHEDVLPLLKTAAAMLCDTSSIAIEYLMLEKPLVTYRAKNPGPQQINIVETTELKSALTRALEYPPDLMNATRTFVNGLHPYRDGLSSQRILTAVDSFLSSDRTDLKRKPMNLLRKWKIRRKLGYHHLC
jgi:UDP-N-acetylglucosamine 2-epimerase